MGSRYEISNSQQSLLQKVINDINNNITRIWVNRPEYNFDSYWGELELSFSVEDDITDCQLIEFRNELLNFFNQYYPEDELSFEWRIVFKRSNQVLDVLCPEDSIRDTHEILFDLSL